MTTEAAPDLWTESGFVCIYPPLISAAGIWQGGNPFNYALPLLITQIVLVVVVTRFMVYILKPLRQPRVLAEIIGGIILGPSVLGKLHSVSDVIFPKESLMGLETLAQFGLLFFLFLVGVEMDILVIKRMGKKALVIALIGMALPFGIGVGASFIFRHQISKNVHQAPFLLFLGVALSVTAFPVLARILAEIKLLNTELGRIAMSSAIINDMCAWILLALSIALADKHETTLSSLWVLLCAIGYILVCFYVVRPTMWWLIRRVPEGGTVSDMAVGMILTGVMLSGFVTDVIGIHSVFGAFMYGLVIPNGGRLGETLVDKLEDFVNGLLLPLFFVISGMKTDLTTMRDPIVVGLLVLVFLLSSAGKILGTLLIALFYNMPFRDGLSLGFLMNTRGLVEMIILNIGRDKEVLDDESFAAMVVMSIIMTAFVTPVVTTIHKPARRLLGYKRRNLQRSKPDTELRMLSCVHTSRNVPSMISFLDISNPTKRAPIFVYVLHLIELTGRSSAMLIARSAGSSSKSSTTSASAQSENIFIAFENFEQHAGGVSIQPLTAVSPYSTMHEDICGFAADKHVSFIVLPFHKQQTVDGAMEAPNPAVRSVNENVLAHAPCSVGILVDRGLSSSGLNQRSASIQHLSHNVAVLFFGGPDDREALAYAWRMVDHPGVSLSVIRFIPGSSSPTPPPPALSDPRAITVLTSEDRERELDDDYFGEFRLKNVSNESVMYMEKVVNNSEETVTVIRNMECTYDMYVVGRGQGEGAVSQLTAGLTEWSECPELGPIGDLLAASDFAATVSVLVMQQYVGAATAESPRRHLFNTNNVGDQMRGSRPPPNAFNVNWNGRASQLDI